MPPWNELVIYEMHVGTFNDPGRSRHLRRNRSQAALPPGLGINAIEIMPVAEFAMAYSWGYNPPSPSAVETALGGPQGHFSVRKAAHAHGIAVILDVVYNHFGPGDLDLWRFDGWNTPTKRRHLLLRQQPRRTPTGDNPAGLRTAGSPPVPAATTPCSG